MSDKRQQHHSLRSDREYRRKFWSQNFFRDPALVRNMLRSLPIDETDVVYEIGPGKGLITQEPAKVAGRVVAVEKDPELCIQLQQRFRDVDNVRVLRADFLEYEIQEPVYKVVANIPFRGRANRRVAYVPSGGQPAVQSL